MGNVSARKTLLIRVPQLRAAKVSPELALRSAAQDRVAPPAASRQFGARDGYSNAARRSVRVALNLVPMGSLPNQRLQRAGAWVTDACLTAGV